MHFSARVCVFLCLMVVLATLCDAGGYRRRSWRRRSRGKSYSSKGYSKGYRAKTYSPSTNYVRRYSDFGDRGYGARGYGSRGYYGGDDDRDDHSFFRNSYGGRDGYGRGKAGFSGVLGLSFNGFGSRIFSKHRSDNRRSEGYGSRSTYSIDHPFYGGGRRPSSGVYGPSTGPIVVGGHGPVVDGPIVGGPIGHGPIGISEPSFVGGHAEPSYLGAPSGLYSSGVPEFSSGAYGGHTYGGGLPRTSYRKY